jgi:isocitrate/isopropylmalate dehydrogenase
VLLAGVDLLRYVGQGDVADRVVKAIREALKKSENHTPDLGGQANTVQYTDAVIRLLN